MPRFYSLSNDPHFSRHEHRRIVEIAVSVHESENRWKAGNRTGVGSGYFERVARNMIDNGATNVTVPMFRGLMANPLAKEFIADGPMLLIGAGVGIAPFRGFVQRRLQNANCVNKVWVLQGVRDSLVDELYHGEWGVSDEEIKKVVESRRGTKKYVQDEVRAQADLVWFVINSLDGRVFVCGSSKGMGEGVEQALCDVAVEKGRLSASEAKEFWKKKKEGGQYIAVSVPLSDLEISTDMITGDLVIGHIPERVYIRVAISVRFFFFFFLKGIYGVRWCNLFSGEIGHFAGGFCFSICVFFVAKNLDGLMMVDARKAVRKYII